MAKKIVITERDRYRQRKREEDAAKKEAKRQGSGKVRKHSVFTFGTSDSYFVASRAHRK